MIVKSGCEGPRSVLEVAVYYLTKNGHDFVNPRLQTTTREVLVGLNSVADSLKEINFLFIDTTMLASAAVNTDQRIAMDRTGMSINFLQYFFFNYNLSI